VTSNHHHLILPVFWCGAGRTNVLFHQVSETFHHGVAIDHDFAFDIGLK
jgi:hypothetical protein